MVRRLTKTKDGVPYGRPLAIEAEIDVALRQEPAELRRRLLVTDRKLPEYLHSETLTHLIRDGVRTGDHSRLNVALPALLGRCEKNLLAKIPDGVLPNAERLRDEVLGELGEVMARDGKGDNPDELDFFECRFNRAFRTLRIDVVRREMRDTNRDESLPNPPDDAEPNAYEDILARVAEEFRSPATQEQPIFRKQLVKAIKGLPDDERTAVIICSVMGLPQESKDPNQRTAATLCHCTGRTIQNRLARAAAKLAQFKEDV